MSPILNSTRMDGGCAHEPLREVNANAIHGKRAKKAHKGCVAVSLIVVFASVAIVVGVFYFIFCMKSSFRPVQYFIQGVEVNAQTNAVAQAVCSHVAAYRAAEEDLRNELNVWFSIAGLFGVVFGLLVPVGSYLLQRQSLRDERELMQKELERAKAENEKQVESVRTECEKALEANVAKMNSQIKAATADFNTELSERSRPMWNFLGSNFDRFLVEDMKSILLNGKNVDWAIVANFIIEFDLCLDCLARAKMPQRIREVVQHFGSPIVQFGKMHPNVWNVAMQGLRQKMRPSDEFLDGKEYKNVLGCDGETYHWLEDFYAQFAPWKFA